MTTAISARGMLREQSVAALFLGLRLYTKHMPFKRGRGAFIRLIEALKRRNWNPPLMSIGNGLVMEFEPSLIGWTCFETGAWEPEQTAAVSQFFRPGGIVLNVSANTGYYALIAAALTAPLGHVHAFEIQSRIIDILRRNVSRNGLERAITIVPNGCFSSEKEATIDCPSDPGSARVVFGSAGEPVKLITIDSYASINALSKVDVVLIDAEGADFEILKGAHTVLRRFRPVVMAEAHHLEAFGGTERQMIEFMSQLGYSVSTIQGEFSRDLLFLPSTDWPAKPRESLNKQPQSPGLEEWTKNSW